MTEASELRAYLIGVFKDLILTEAKTTLSKIDSFRHDSTTGEFRTGEELSQIESQIREKAKRMSEDFIDELEVKGVITSQDYEDESKVIMETYETYRMRFLKWLKEQ